MELFKKNFLRYFLFFFLLFFFIFNWDKISLVFYPQYFWRTIKYFYLRSASKSFQQEKNLQPIEKKEENKEEKKENQDSLPQIIENFEFTEKENSVEIPSLEIFVPLVMVNSESEIEKGLERGAVLHPISVLPPNPGRTIILGHSTRHRFSKEIAVWAFTYLTDVKEGDEIILNLNNRRFHYFVEKKFIAREDEDLEDSKTENLLYLVTCWPPGRLVFKQRLVVLAKMK